MNKKTTSLLVMFRNGLAFSFAWLVIVILGVALFTGATTVSTAFLGKILVLCIGASILFSLVFSDVVFEKSTFIKRLTAFVVSFIPLEVISFYWMGLFQGAGKLSQWIFFVGIILVFYLVSLVIDVTVFANRGKKYTSQLNKYKARRLTKDELRGTKE